MSKVTITIPADAVKAGDHLANVSFPVRNVSRGPAGLRNIVTTDGAVFPRFADEPVTVRR